MVRKSASMLLYSLLFVMTIQPVASLGAIRQVSPSDMWCNIINSASPGDEIIFNPGSYTTPCWITVRGSSSSLILVRSQSALPGQQATFAYSGSTSNVIELRDAAHLILRGFAFARTQDGVNPLRIWRANDIVIEQNSFQESGAVTIAVNSNDCARITVRQNTFKNLKATGLYFGCHNGVDCHATDVRIEANLIDGVDPTNQGAIGYGLEIKLNSYGTVRDNTIYNTKGPGLMVYGSNRNDPASIVEGNYAEGSRTDGGIVVGGGPAIVRNNVVVGNAYGGISVQNYASRNLQQNVWVVHNTILNNADSGINVQGWNSGTGNVIAFNAISLQSGTPSLRPSAPTGTITGNVTCGVTAPCFVQAATPPYDPWPALNSPLLDAAGTGSEPWRPGDDFIGLARIGPADIGAFERTLSSVAHFVGGGAPRPARVTSQLTPPVAPTNLMVQ
jgi:hypothetical protein